MNKYKRLSRAPWGHDYSYPDQQSLAEEFSAKVAWMAGEGRSG